MADQCRNLVVLGADPAFCAGGGPPIQIGAASDSERCAGDLAESTFRWGLCPCDGITTNNPFSVDAYDSTIGPYTPGGPGGGAGTNGAINANEAVSVTGTLWAAANAGVRVNDDAAIGQRLYSGGVVNLKRAAVGDNAYVVGNINVDRLSVERTLHVSPNTTLNGNVSYQNLVTAALQVGRACTACTAEERIDVAGIVAAHRGQNNDNALIGLDPGALSGSAGNVRLELPCGQYYLNAINVSGPTTIVAKGNTVLYIDGNVSANNELTITLAPNAHFDVFVAGNVTLNNPFRLGSPNYPALMRLYLGGANGFTTNNEIQIGGYIYAVPGGITTNNEIEVYGGLYSQNFNSNNEISIHYDRGVATVGRHCPDDEPIDPIDPNDPDAGSDIDGSDPDAGTNPNPDPVCRSTNAVCSSDGDCCSPLLCHEGVCALLACQPAFGPCTQNANCCSNLCAVPSGGGQGACIVN
ncbi:MAG: hypothetical protein H0U74_14790 [Bradymonadaceae bacterium]|nr:hypothetical protein [Lujinxingiaceae bacterium]